MCCPASRTYAAPLQGADSVRTLFSGTLYFSPGNGDWIEQSEYIAVGRFLRAAQEHPETEIRLVGYADTIGTASFNLRLSQKRAAAIGRYLVRKGIDASRIRTEGLGEDIAAATPREARRVEMSGIITPPRTENPASESTDYPDDNGFSAEPLQPVADTSAGQTKADTTARSGAARQVEPTTEDSTRQTSAASDQSLTASASTADSAAGAAEHTPTSSPSVSDGSHAATGERIPSSEPTVARYVAVKTNLAAWAGTILNVAADVQVGRHWSVELPVLWCPWYVSDRHAVKTFTIQPEARYWLAKPGEGHFFGLHAHMGWFNVRWNRDRYQDADRPLLGAGISYGYLLPFNEHWAGEFTLGAGYANMRYDTYYNIDNGARIDTRTKNYWGITRVGISVVYRFNIKK